MTPDPSVFLNLNEKIVNDILNYLAAQGHSWKAGGGGELERSIKLILETNGSKYTIAIDAVDYLLDLEYGVSPEDMQRKDIDVEKLAKWIKFRRSQGHQVPSVNRLIKKWAEQGFELPSAIRFSTKPTVNFGVNSTFNYFEQDYYHNIDEIAFKSLDDQFFTTKSGTVK